MERKLIAGDYVPDGEGGLTVLSGSEEVLARVLFRLTARRGGLSFLPELGSRLHLLVREKPSARPALAARYVAEALAEERDIKLDGVQFDLHGEWAQLQVRLEWKGQPLSLELPLTSMGAWEETR